MTNAKYTTEYKIDNTKNINVTNTIAMAVEKEMNLTKALEEIGKIYKCSDISLIREIHKTEKLFNLPKHEFMGQVNLESQFKNISRMDNNNKISYGVCQMQMDTARDAFRKMSPMLEEMNIFIQPPTIELLKDSEYAIKFSGAYMRFLHNKYENPRQALASYNSGELNTKHESSGYEYSYTLLIQERMAEFEAIIGDSY